MDNLFAARADESLAAVAPLATRMRPRTLDEVVGQPQLMGETAAFRSLVESGRLASMILWGPPGTGKTTLARLVAGKVAAAFETLSATSAGVKEVREVLARARHRLEIDEQRTVLFLDEIHRFSKNQQDALLPAVEDGTLVLIGATTENPFFEVNSPLISRCTLFRLEPIPPPELEKLVERALDDGERGLGERNIKIEGAAREALASRSGGDARLVFNTLETAAALAEGRGAAVISLEDVTEAMQRRVIRYDKTGDSHYDVVSAFIKSLRGSDPDAAAYWLHLMLEAGEDPEFIARRMIIFASEDVGLADDTALLVAVAAADALAYVGLPEAAFALTHACLYLATSPKSNSVATTIAAARETVTEGETPSVPLHLRDGSYPGASRLGHGEGYLYPHDHPRHIVEQPYWPEGVEEQVLWRPGEEGSEKARAEWLAALEATIGRQRKRH